MANPAHALDVTPEAELTFQLSRNADVNSRVTMTLTHPGNTDEYLAFKVKTTQPRRYLVRPNQGLMAPHSSETISILLVDKDKQVLLQSYDRLGQPALEHSKDKFLVQSCAVSMDFAKRYSDEKATAAGRKGDAGVQAAKELSEALTSMWNAITSGGSQPVYNKKLHVRHVVVASMPSDSTTVPASNAGKAAANAISTQQIKPYDTTLAQMENMTPEQMFQEVSSLRRKYDELVSFSVNLTAERDILNNTLEQTKRDLNREIASRGSTAGSGDRSSSLQASSSSSSSTGKASFMGTMIQLLVVALAAFFAGIKFALGTSEGNTIVKRIPFISNNEMNNLEEPAQL